MLEMADAEGSAAVPFAIRGISRRIAPHIPKPVWDVISAAVACRKGQTVTLQLLSEEPYVPWELAEMPAPPEPTVPPLLCMQLVTARWVLGEQRPRQPAPAQHTMRNLTVVTGDYSASSQPTLSAATEEAAWLEDTLHAAVVDARRDAVLTLFNQGGGDLIHFAVHGHWSGKARDGLILADDWILTQLQVEGAELAEQPLVVLNACQVGQGNELLGDYAGLGAAFLCAGASAVLAPLWSIGDAAADVFARAFYTALLGGTAPAAALHEIRRGWQAQSATTSISLAYLFFGHPLLDLSWPDIGNPPSPAAINSP